MEIHGQAINNIQGQHPWNYLCDIINVDKLSACNWNLHQQYRLSICFGGRVKEARWLQNISSITIDKMSCRTDSI
jgi:hypothetical protein